MKISEPLTASCVVYQSLLLYTPEYTSYIYFVCVYSGIYSFAICREV